MAHQSETDVNLSPVSDSEFPDYTTHTSSFLEGRIGSVRVLLTRLAPGLVRLFSKKGVSEEEVGVSDKEVE